MKNKLKERYFFKLTRKRDIESILKILIIIITASCWFFEVNCPLVEPGPIGGVPSVRVFLRNPSPYLCEDILGILFTRLCSWSIEQINRLQRSTRWKTCVLASTICSPNQWTAERCGMHTCFRTNCKAWENIFRKNSWNFRLKPRTWFISDLN